MYTLKKISEITGADFYGENNLIRNYSTDSRNITSYEETLFVALKSGRNNGHNYIEELIERGQKSFLIQKGEFNFEKYLSDLENLNSYLESESFYFDSAFILHGDGESTEEFNIFDELLNSLIPFKDKVIFIDISYKERK